MGLAVSTEGDSNPAGAIAAAAAAAVRIGVGAAAADGGAADFGGSCVYDVVKDVSFGRLSSSVSALWKSAYDGDAAANAAGNCDGDGDGDVELEFSSRKVGDGVVGYIPLLSSVRTRSPRSFWPASMRWSLLLRSFPPSSPRRLVLR